MLFVITAFDRPGALERRLQVRPTHLDYLESKVAQIKVAGPLLGECTQSIGSLLIIEAHDRHAAASPTAYRREAVFERMETRAWRPALGSWAS